MNLALVCRQAGTAAAFSALVRWLVRNRPGVEVHSFVYPPAAGTWEADRLGGSHVSEFADARAILDRGRWRLVLTGTSLEVADDAEWWRWAAGKGVPSVAFVDQWTNYRERFLLPGGELVPYLPDNIAVVDGLARDRLRQAGLPEDRVVITGSPAFDRLASMPANRDRLRAQLDIDCRKVLVLFAAEPPPLHETHEATKARLGYTEAEVLDLLCRTLQSVQIDATVYVRPHPIQRATGLLPRLPPSTRSVRIRVDPSDRRSVLYAADIVAGMTSMLLLEASLLGLPVVSLQPARRFGSDLTDHRPGIRVVTQADDCAIALRAALTQRPRELPKQSPDIYSAAFSAAVIDRMGNEP